MKTKNKYMKKLLEKYIDIYALNSASSLLHWDMETYMPKNSYNERGIITGRLNVLSQRLMKSKEFRDLFEKARKSSNGKEKGIIRELERDFHYYDSLPEPFIEEFNKATVIAMKYWLMARKKNDFKIFQPYLKRIIELSKKKAELLGYKEKPYDALLDLYEEGLTTKYLQPIFGSLKKSLPRILKLIEKKGIFFGSHELEAKHYDIEGMKKLNLSILKRFGYPLLKRARIDVSEHPFTIEISGNDVRITTFYPEKNFKESLLATIHEFGHALYELQIDKDLWFTPISHGISLGVHESQSRFWENMIGRNKQFVSSINPLIRRYLRLERNDFELYRYFNMVKPSFIRIKSDEVTYNLHILIRFEIEQEMINNEIDVRELPQLWNEKMEKYLGITPRNIREGVIQDIHWTHGSIGYFPTYTIGTLLSVQIYKAMSKKVNIEKAIMSKDYSKVRDWLRERIHKYGSTYAPRVLIRKALRQDLNPEVFIDYLKNKYLTKNI